MKQVFEEYGNYIVAIIGASAVIISACLILGFYHPAFADDAVKQAALKNAAQHSDLNEADINSDGDGLFGRCIGRWLDMSM